MAAPIRFNALNENISFALGAVREHKLRAFLTILGIIVGVATVISMVSVIEGFNQVVVRGFSSFGSTLVQFQKMEPRHGDPTMAPEEQRLRKNLTYEDAVEIKRSCPSIAAVSPERYNFLGGNVRFRDVVANGPLIGGTNPEYPFANNYFVKEGRFFNDAEFEHSANVVVLGQEVVEALFPRIDPIGRTILIEGRPFTVVGSLEPRGGLFFGPGDNRLFMPLTTFDSLYPDVEKQWGTIIATVPKSPELMMKAMEEGREVLRRRRRVPPEAPDDFAIVTPDAFISTFRQITGGIAAVLTFISSIGLLVGGVGVMNIMLVAVKERTREIGVRKAVGARRSDITMQFLTEAMTLTGLGGIAGIMVGLSISWLTGRFSPLPSATPLWAVVLGFLVSVSVGLFFGIYPAFKAASGDPIESLRYA
ncbi:MAG TPA: ABC transporter permease [Candidatus Polarisedimenticolia bacterium]|nr:ABC transporter permease [Candidatus Polarisedimenticolia bacterium]